MSNYNRITKLQYETFESFRIVKYNTILLVMAAYPSSLKIVVTNKRVTAKSRRNPLIFLVFVTLYPFEWGALIDQPY